jgi:nucleoid-associated protein YgaU
LLLVEVLGYARQAVREIGTLKQAASLVPSGERKYVVQDGDTLLSIAVKCYGSRGGWEQIAVANGIWLPSDLVVGREIVIPGQR